MTNRTPSIFVAITLMAMAVSAALSSCAHDHTAGSDIAVGAATPSAIIAPAPAPPPAATTQNPYRAINIPNRTLDANLYIQTSAEYRALCLQTYDFATSRLKEKLAGRPSAARPAAVILDLDETVFDNSAFQSFMEREGKGYDGRLWDEWERHPDAVRMVPGAKDFLDAATSLGVTIMYVSNREDVPTTTKALALNGLTVDSTHQLFLKENQLSNKDLRRAAIREKYDVLILIGDNLTDFSSEFSAPRVSTADEAAKAISERAAKVDTNRAHFGTDWFMLPNSVYGDWQRLVNEFPREQLRPVDTMTYPTTTP